MRKVRSTDMHSQYLATRDPVGARALWTMAGGALAAGASVYLFVRGPSSLYLLRAARILPIFSLHLPQAILVSAAWIPSFTHAFAFSLATAASVHPRRRLMVGACMLWAVIGSGFEVVQATKPYWPASRNYLIPEIVRAYVVNGVFDWWDLFAVWAGAAVAALAINVGALTPRRFHRGGL
ncbi:MAG: hypothetical protein ABI629_08550 [bacterium]